MKLQLLSPAQHPQALCLDGSPGGYLYEAGQPGTHRWLIFLEGGGWCYSIAECHFRAKTQPVGSSKGWAEELRHSAGTELFPHSPLSNESSVNPFAGFHKVVVKYCDGGSFMGDAAHHGLQFRGRRILEAVFHDLRKRHGLGSRQGAQLLLNGCSAGGLGAVLAANYIRTQLPPSVRKYKVLSCSGFFLERGNLWGDPVYAQEMRAVFEMQGLANTLNTECLAAMGAESWRCVLAQNAAPYVRAPLFILNSAVDSWQLGCVLSAVASNKSAAEDNRKYCSNPRGSERWDLCVEHGRRGPLTRSCSSQQVQEVKQFGQDFKKALLDSGLLRRPTNGAFITSCVSHCGAYYGNQWHITRLRPVEARLGGMRGVVMSQAVWNWWADDAPRDASSSNPHIYFPCELTEEYPYECDPSCRGVEPWVAPAAPAGAQGLFGSSGQSTAAVHVMTWALDGPLALALLAMACVWRCYCRGRGQDTSLSRGPTVFGRRSASCDNEFD